MKPEERLKRMGVVEHQMQRGCGEASSCYYAGVSVAWYRRWKSRFAVAGFEGLRDRPRSGRPLKD